MEIFFGCGQVKDCVEQVYLHEGAPNPETSSNLDNPEGSKDQFGNQNVDLHSSKKKSTCTKWSNLLELRVKHSLIVGVGIQLF
jgi:hypothetical protein